jgi:hypothetical protein
MAGIGSRFMGIGHWCAACLRWCGEQCQRIRNVLSPLADLRIMLIVLILGGILLLFVDAGEDVIRQLADSANATDFQPTLENAPIFLRWTVFLLACVWTGLNAWYWAHLLYKTKPGATDEQPAWFTWVRRGLGVLPLIFAIVAMPLSARHGLRDNWIAMLVFAVAAALMIVFFLRRSKITEDMTEKNWKLTQAADPDTPDRGPNTIVRGDIWFVWFTSLLSVAVLAILSVPVVRTHFAWAMGPAALTFGAIGCIIPLTSMLIYITRPYQIPIVLVGIWAFVIFSVWNDNHAVRTLDKSATVSARPTVGEAYRIWQGKHPDPMDPLILIASAGGASRAAYWTGTVLRAFDDRTDGGFFDHVFAISSVSGGTLGAIGYAAWLSERSPDVEKGKSGADQRRDFVQNFFGGDYLGPSLGGLLYPDLVQRFLPFRIFPDRASSLEEAFEMGWNSSMNGCRKLPCGAKPDRFAQDYTSLWANALLYKADGRWVPLVFANGTHVETGKRIITAPVAVDSNVFEDVYDFYALNPAAVRASTAVLNSARFTLVSPAGRMMKEGHTSGGIIDGGYFENGALETLYDLARFIEAQDHGRKIIIIEILNDDTMSKEDLSRHPPAALDIAPAPKAHWYSDLLGEFTSIVGGLYETRSSRGILGAKRLSAPLRSGLVNANFVSFDLRPYGHDCQTTLNRIKTFVVSASELDTDCHTAMSWALSLGSRDAMDVSFNTTAADLSNFFASRHYTEARLKQQLQDLQVVVSAANAPGGYNDTLNKVLEQLQNKVTIQGAQAPSAAVKRY